MWREVVSTDVNAERDKYSANQRKRGGKEKCSRGSESRWVIAKARRHS